MTQTPFRIQRILFPTDFSKSSESAAPHVAGLAKAVNATVTILNLVPWLSGWHGKSEPHFTVSDDVLRKLDLNQKATEASCLKTLEALKKRHFQAMECDLCVKTDGVAESIVEYAQEIQADLIMMPTRGMGPPRPFLIGSATAKVLHDARCAVWTTPHPRELETFRFYRQIVCAMDYRVLSQDLLARASQAAHLFQSRLSVMTAIPCPAPRSVSCSERPSVRSLKSETVSALQDLLQELSISAPLHVLEGTVGEGIRQAVAMEDADLVVIGRGHLDEPSGHLRTHAYEIIWNSPCPVLSL
ncbi:MAG TPA: universal stress protein [Bryobacteraceae bacterium]|jgi:nucleotide-binding universal stress UspA family protein